MQRNFSWLILAVLAALSQRTAAFISPPMSHHAPFAVRAFTRSSEVVEESAFYFVIHHLVIKPYRFQDV